MKVMQFLTCTQKNGIRFGLSAVKNVGVALIEKLERERQRNGLFKNLYDFWSAECREFELNKRALERSYSKRCTGWIGMESAANASTI